MRRATRPITDAERDDPAVEAGGLTVGGVVIPERVLRGWLTELRSEYGDTPGYMWNGALDHITAKLDEYAAEAPTSDAVPRFGAWSGGGSE